MLRSLLLNKLNQLFNIIRFVTHSVTTIFHICGWLFTIGNCWIVREGTCAKSRYSILHWLAMRGRYKIYSNLAYLNTNQIMTAHRKGEITRKVLLCNIKRAHKLQASTRFMLLSDIMRNRTHTHTRCRRCLFEKTTMNGADKKWRNKMKRTNISDTSSHEITAFMLEYYTTNGVNGVLLNKYTTAFHVLHVIPIAFGNCVHKSNSRQP